MPKKMGVNSKAAEARARKEAVKNAERELQEKLKEDELWRDDDKHVLKKQTRRDEREKKKQEMAERKAQNRVAYEEERKKMKGRSEEAARSKVTRAEIRTFLEEQSELNKPKRELMHDEKPIEENINRVTVEGEEARSVEDAIAILSVNSSEIDRHPERRLKAAYAAFEESNLPRLKEENPNMRLSQIKQILKKDWMKSPENPLNKRTLEYNAKT